MTKKQKSVLKVFVLSLFFLGGFAISNTTTARSPSACQYYYCEKQTGKCKLNQNGTTCESPTGELPCTTSGVCDPPGNS